jgi:hypothetical protein
MAGSQFEACTQADDQCFRRVRPLRVPGLLPSRSGDHRPSRCCADVSGHGISERLLGAAARCVQRGWQVRVGWPGPAGRVAWQAWAGLRAVRVTGWPVVRWPAARVMVAVPSAAGVATARVSTRPAVVRVAVAACPGASPRKVMVTVTCPVLAAAGRAGVAGGRVWVAVMAGMAGWAAVRATAAVAPASRAAARSRMVAAWVG